MNVTRLLSVALAPIVFAGAASAAGNAYPDRWVYVSRSLRSDQDVADIEKIANTAADHGLTGMLLAGGFDTTNSPEYYTRLQKVKEICRGRNVEIIPIFFSAGYGGSVLSHNRNLAEGLPVVDAHFLVRDGKATLEPDPAVGIVNGWFEEWEGAQPKGYSLVDRPGEIAVADHDVVKEGHTSLRLQRFGELDPQNGHARIGQTVTVKPHCQYRVSIWVRTQDLQPASAFLLQIHTGERQMAAAHPILAPTSDWQQVSLTFDSGAREKLFIYAGLWRGKAGTVWLDGFSLEEIGLVNVLRRPGTPLGVRSADGQSTYEEGKDFAPVADPDLLRAHADPAGPPIRLLPGSRIHEGDHLRVSFYHGMALEKGQISICMSEPQTYDIWREQAAIVEKYLSPKKWFLSMDEIREGGSCRACKDRGMTMGEILGDCITRQVEIIRQAHPGAEVYCWSDMLDPNHNGHGNYYLVDGDYTGSWEHVPKDLIICCWWYQKRDVSLKFFADRGFRTLAGAYYDGNTLDNCRGWLESIDRTPNCLGIMYTTWQDKYALLPGFGDLLKR